jgi:DNA-binding transcriptional LysR family regulator
MSSMSELLKNMAWMAHGIAWLPAWTIVNELRDKRLVCLDTPELMVPIQAYIYRMDTRLNKTAEPSVDVQPYARGSGFARLIRVHFSASEKPSVMTKDAF